MVNIKSSMTNGKNVVKKGNLDGGAKKVSKINPELSLDDIYRVIDLYFKQKNIMFSHLHNSFDKFLDDDIPNLLKNADNTFFERVAKDKIYRYKFVYDNIAIKPPTIENEEELMFPNQARHRNLTYASKLVATISQVQEIIDIATDNITTKVVGQPEYEYPIAIIPVMVRSKYCSLNLKKGFDKNECEYDPGGYFIVNGSEKVVMANERMIDNKPLVFTKKDSTSIIYTVQVNSRSWGGNEMLQIVNIRMKPDNNLTVKVPILQEVPVFILMRALGIESDKDIITSCVYDLNDTDMINLVRTSLENTRFEKDEKKILTQDDALNYLTNKLKVVNKIKYNEGDKNIKTLEKKLHLTSLLEESFLPHIESGLKLKGLYIGYMIHRLLQAFLGRVKIDDRDSYINKRVDLPGALMFDLFKQFYKKMLNDTSKFFRKKNNDDENPQNIINQIKPNIIEQGLKAALLTGAWGKKKGVAQMLQRLSFLQTISSLRRINSPTVDASTNKLTSPRHLHGSQIGFLCVTGDTLVLQGNGTVKRIDQMSNKDTVMTYNQKTGHTETSEINHYFSKMSNGLLKVRLKSGLELKCTIDHPLLTETFNKDYRMIHAQFLGPGDKVLIWDQEMRKFKLAEIDSIEVMDDQMVYDFQTESENHNFVGNSFVISNCYVETPEGNV